MAHYSYYKSVADVWLLSLFRAGPGTWVLWTLRERRRAGKTALRRAHKQQRRQQQRQRQQQGKREGDEAEAAAENVDSSSGSGSGSPVRRQLTRAAAFMMLKTWLSFLAIVGKSSVFEAWDQPLPRGAWWSGWAAGGGFQWGLLFYVKRFSPSR